MADAAEKQPAKDNSKMGKQLEKQARETARDQDRKRAKFAIGKKRFTEGK